MSAPRTVLFLGGNGHATSRLDGARRAAEPRDVELLDVHYPGFEGRERAPDRDSFLRAISEQIDARPDAQLYGTGIGALLLLALRARGALAGRGLLLQGAVLWGLEERLFPKLMVGPLPHVVRRAFALGPMQRHFAEKHFRRPQPPAVLRAFFEGYARCAAFADLFRWLTPRFLRELEAQFAADRTRLADIVFWWGAHDSVVSLAELDLTQRTLDTAWPVRVFEDWGHYPMLDDPAGWVNALDHVLA